MILQDFFICHNFKIFEVETVCGGSELLYDKMERLIKSETIKTPTDKKEKVRYNENSNLFVGRVIRQIKRGLFCQIKTGLSEYLTMV